MDALFIMVLAFVGYLLAYRLYGRYLGSKIFQLAADAKVPAKELQDGVDFVPTKKEVIFGHHFTSIAGTGPIVGPAIAVIWGWVPALLWVFLGSIVMGAVHDFGALIISMRNQGKSVSEFTSKYINPRTRFIFFLIVFLELLIITAIFGLVIAVIFAMYPGSVLPVWLEIPIAMALGWAVYKRGASVLLWSIVAVGAMYLTVWWGAYAPIVMPEIAGMPATGTWTLILLAYAFFASVLPVTTLLQPRDFINSHQLMIAMGLLVLGVFVAAFTTDMAFVAPAVQASPEAAPSMWPFLFITIACGAISGFHSLVSSGTSAKQIANEKDSLFVGYGGMLTESSLSMLVIIATCAGIGLGYTTKAGASLAGVGAWSAHYSSWTAAAGLGSKISAFVVGAANMMESFGMPHAIAIVIMGVFVASFAGTTLDTATRVQRYVLSELFTSLGFESFRNKYVATFVAVAAAAMLAFATGASGKGALTLWPLFGAVNQVLAALVLTVITLYLLQRGSRGWILTAIPACFMVVMTFWALVINQGMYMKQGNVLLQIINGLVLVIAAWVVVEGVLRFVATLGGTPTPAADTAR
ncbi:MAG TPA: carbon starvation protein A [Deltaproteobacteria bacterium]|nr:carbon starvation protein A [Deltaproteobacteria bacterium]